MEKNMKRAIPFVLLALLTIRAEAIVISRPGTYVIDSNVDEVIVDSALNTSDVWIQVVSGGRIDNDVGCLGFGVCAFRTTVSGSGSVLGRVTSGGGLIEIRDSGWVRGIGIDWLSGGRVVVADNAYLGRVGTDQATNPGWAEITGGYVGSVGGWPVIGRVSMSDGVLGSSLIGSGVQLNLTDGLILGNVESVGDGPLTLAMRGGQVLGDLVADQVALTGFISGGTVSGNIRTSGLGSGGPFDIYGGLFGVGTTNPFWRLGGVQTFNVHGRDLMLENGFLTGYLLDGSYLSVGVTFTQTWRGQLNLINVPEPGSLALFSVALFGVFAVRRNRRAVQ